MPMSPKPYGLPWGMRNRDPGAPSLAAVPGPQDPSALGSPWPFKAAAGILAAPAIDYAGHLYVTTEAGLLHRVQPTGEGTEIYDAGSPVRTSPALVLGSSGTGNEGEPPGIGAVYLGDDAGFLHCVQGDGTLLWTLSPGIGQDAQGVPLRSDPVVHRAAGSSRSRIFVGCDDGRLFAVSETTAAAAATDWEYSVLAPLRTSPVLSADGMSVHLATADGFLHTLDALSGQLRHSPVKLSGTQLHTPALD
ncbi:PQQ-like beta-propeller repeat protein, partial [Streptomyces sp. WM6386]|uniref:PQQ-like beta-propeller repeat protein n=1 Tax=Streptomyces sp. WM6386 TaxID=1415558 RepID=UPI000619DE9E